ncbi:MAG: tripartite tricarboxylate transporter substrate-binding protein, partial [Casimicrobiaceae bacterium]
MQRNRIRLLLALCAGLGAVLLPWTAAAQAQSYPNRPVRLIVPFAPGGGTDILMRILAPKLSEALGQPIVIDNRPGASSIIGTELVAKAPADGYTLLAVDTSYSVNPSLHAKLPYDSVKDLAPVI